MLTPEQVDKVRLVLTSVGWNDVIRPEIENRVRKATRSLTLTDAERTQTFKGTDFDTTDSVLRAMIRDCEWFLFSWVNEVAVSEHNQRRDELDRQLLP